MSKQQIQNAVVNFVEFNTNKLSTELKYNASQREINIKIDNCKRAKQLELVLPTYKDDFKNLKDLDQVLEANKKVNNRLRKQEIINFAKSKIPTELKEEAALENDENISKIYNDNTIDQTNLEAEILEEKKKQNSKRRVKKVFTILPIIILVLTEIFVFSIVFGVTSMMENAPVELEMLMIPLIFLIGFVIYPIIFYSCVLSIVLSNVLYKKRYRKAVRKYSQYVEDKANDKNDKARVIYSKVYNYLAKEFIYPYYNEKISAYEQELIKLEEEYKNKIQELEKDYQSLEYKLPNEITSMYLSLEYQEMPHFIKLAMNAESETDFNNIYNSCKQMEANRKTLELQQAYNEKMYKQQQEATQYAKEQADFARQQAEAERRRVELAEQALREQQVQTQLINEQAKTQQAIYQKQQETAKYAKEQAKNSQRIKEAVEWEEERNRYK